MGAPAATRAPVPPAIGERPPGERADAFRASVEGHVRGRIVLRVGA